MKKFLFLLFLLLATQFVYAEFDASSAFQLGIAYDDIASIETGGEWIYPTNKIPYVTNGLIAYWDGIWNAGLGQHDDNATVWKDLSGNGFDGYQQQESGWLWTNNAYVGLEKNNHGFIVSNIIDVININLNSLTFECVIKVESTNKWDAVFGQYNGQHGITYEIDGRNIEGDDIAHFRAYYNNNPNLIGTNTNIINNIFSFSTISSDSNTEVYYNGIFNARKSAVTMSPVNGYNFCIAKNHAKVYTNKTFVGKIYCIRVYNHPLMEEEIKYNSAIDALRFDNKDLCADSTTYNIVSKKYTKSEYINGTTIWEAKIPYSTNGLLAMWDGIWNAGIGQHDNTTTTWKDISGNGFDATQRVATGWKWNNQSYIGIERNGHGFATPISFVQALGSEITKTNHTIEYIAKPQSRASISNTRMAFFSGRDSYPISLEYSVNGQVRVLYNLNGEPDYLFDWNHTWSPTGYPGKRPRHTIAISVCETNMNFYFDGEYVGTTNVNPVASTQYQMIIGGANDFPELSIYGILYGIRVYDRVLTDEEIERHYKLDDARFYDDSYADDAYVWIDLNDMSSLWLDSTRYTNSAVGQIITNIEDKVRINPRIFHQWKTDMIRAENGIVPADISTIESTNSSKLSRLYQSTTGIEFKGTNCYNCEFAMALVIDNDRCPNSTAFTRLIQPGTFEIFRMVYNSKNLQVGVLNPDGVDSLITVGTGKYANLRRILGSRTSLYMIKIKVIDRKKYLTVSVNGTVIYNQICGMISGTYSKKLLPSVNANNYGNMPCNYLEYIFWKTIPENWDEIEKALMKKYKIEPLDNLAPYKYAKNAFSWIDLTDESTLWADTNMTVHPQVGETVLCVNDKADSSAVWNSTMTKSVYGLSSTNQNPNTGQGYGKLRLDKNAVISISSNYLNYGSFATAIVWCNDKFNSTNEYTGKESRIFFGVGYKIFSMGYYGNRLYWRHFSSSYNHQNSNFWRKPGYHLIIAYAESQDDGTSKLTIKYDGKLVETVIDPIDTSIIDSFRPSINTPENNDCMCVDYVENIWWKKIPGDFEQIEKALMEKYNIQPLK